ncbi:helix-turn-helix transcriptional regulator [Angustibacter sp. McL0619]|uniref:helix-turn-helix transcriptional regulator n=1 Tax=Angustibacter sp. McL0619 TaxID=3415676 RepID=UPI003CF96126
MSTSARMLQLLSLLQTHRYWPGGELAQRLEVSPRTLRRDVERLRDLGYPVDAGRGVGGGYQLRAGAQLPPMLLDADEAVAVAVALRTAAGGSVTGIEDAALGALAKIVQVMPPALRRRVDALQEFTEPVAMPAARGGSAVHAGDLTVLAQACRDGERVLFEYRARQRRPVQRSVDPHRLVALGRRWYLVAWDVDRADWRTFRVDRLSGCQPSGARFRPREIPGGDAATFVRTSIETRPRHAVLVELAAPAHQVRQALGGWGTLEVVDEVTCTLQVQADSFDWVVLMLSVAGAEFTVRRPPELVEHLAQTAHRLLRGANRPTTGPATTPAP